MSRALAQRHAARKVQKFGFEFEKAERSLIAQRLWVRLDTVAQRP
jgi:hypothetical protein